MTPRRSAERIALLVCGTCALTVGVIATAGARGPTAAHRLHRHPGCRAAAHPHRLHARRRRCRAVLRTPHPSPSVTRPSAAVGPPTAGGAAGGAPAPASSAPAATQPVPGAPEAPAPPSTPHVQVTAVEYSLTLSRTTVPAGKVVLEFVNHGQDEHNLNAVAGEGPLSASLANTPADGVRDQAVELRPGAYTLFCSLPEHERKGMKATLTVE